MPPQRRRSRAELAGGCRGSAAPTEAKAKAAGARLERGDRETQRCSWGTPQAPGDLPPVPRST